MIKLFLYIMDNLYLNASLINEKCVYEVNYILHCIYLIFNQ